MGRVVYLRPSTNKGKKFTATIVEDDGKTKTVHFGASGYSDYTIHKDEERRQNYINRHRANENWGISGIGTAGFWSRWILWEKPTLASAKRAAAKKFNITIKSGNPAFY